MVPWLVLLKPFLHSALKLIVYSTAQTFTVNKIPHQKPKVLCCFSVHKPLLSFTPLHDVSVFIMDEVPGCPMCVWYVQACPHRARSLRHTLFCTCVINHHVSLPGPRLRLPSPPYSTARQPPPTGPSKDRIVPKSNSHISSFGLFI